MPKIQLIMGILGSFLHVLYSPTPNKVYMWISTFEMERSFRHYNIRPGG